MDHGAPGARQCCLTDRANQNLLQMEHSLSAHCIADIKLTRSPLLALLKWLSTTNADEPDKRVHYKEPPQYAAQRYGSATSPVELWHLEKANTRLERRRPRNIPLSQAWPGEEKYELVERCYEIYRKALARYNPVPIDLQTPPTFFYWKKKLGYCGSLPILPEDFLTEDKLKVLLPLLAQHIYWYNLRELGDILSGTYPALTPDYAPGGWFTAWFEVEDFLLQIEALLPG